MKSLARTLKRSSMLLAATLFLGVVLMPSSQIKAAANWWWVTHYPSQAPGGYVCRVGATSNGSMVRARLEGISTSNRQYVYSWGSLVSAPTPSYTGTLDVWSPIGYYTYY